MAALTADRTIYGAEKQGRTRGFPMAANVKIYRGGLVAINSSGLAVPASDAAGLVVIGVCEQTADNLGGAASAKSVTVRMGEVCDFATTGGSAIVAADVGRQCFVLDDQTVVKTGGTTNQIVAGIVLAINSATSVKVLVGNSQ